MTLNNIAIIGAGQLGSRHLQGLKTASSPLAITVVDSNDESLRIAEERYDAIDKIGEKTIQYVNTIENLPTQLDLVIVATSSKPRASIVKSLLTHSSVRYLILEKVLFTQLSDYDEIGTLLKKKNVRCWVNCPRRMFGSYSMIKDSIDYTHPIKMEYVGKNWGLCCNAMHFIDVFMYLVQNKTFTINTDRIESEIHESKRPGYIEMYGTLRITTESGDELNLSCLSSVDQPARVEIKNGLNYFALDEISGILLKDGKETKVDTPYQSQTTGFLADSILRTGYCPLTSYEKSAQYHKVFIQKILEKYNEITGEDSKALPIT